MSNTISTKLALAAAHDAKADQLGETEEAAWHRMSAESLRWEAEAMLAEQAERRAA